ncbi:hypothetical protein LK540_14110 [Massilia sp. IC2-278]|uniref:hypothetical protein n=1 Tax=Massilia sp. IC2-278 TaxID=2887200 RepID=UPI001E2C6943|nr:hypothetical protein [Massilia sp. IC2-278]MCC2961560.1 hypothetical protein [Massilia sp. IC2-278]
MTVRILSAGDKGQAICAACAGVATTTYAYRDVPFSDGKGRASDILVGVCDSCDAVLSIPPQSTPAIKRARSSATESIEAVLPAPYVDALDLACFTVDPAATTELRKKIVLFYVHKFADGSFDIEALRSTKPFFSLQRGQAVRRRRLSMKVSTRLAADFSKVVTQTAMSRTDVLKQVVGEIKRQIVDGENPAVLGELRTLAYLE